MIPTIKSFHHYKNLYLEIIIKWFKSLNFFLKVFNAKSCLIKSNVWSNQNQNQSPKELTMENIINGKWSLKNINTASNRLEIFPKGNVQFIFLCNPPKLGILQVSITCLQITQKILTKDIFHWLELITEILSFLQNI